MNVVFSFCEPEYRSSFSDIPYEVVFKDASGRIGVRESAISYGPCVIWFSNKDNDDIPSIVVSLDPEDSYEIVFPVCLMPEVNINLCK